jgi:hypothetical protein
MSLELLRRHYLDQPQEVSIETLAVCNAACTFCPYPTLERIGAKLPDAVLWDLVEQMASFKQPFFVSPFKVNEPLLDKRLQGFCERIVEFVPHATLRLFTNGSPLTAHQIDWIADIPTDRLDCLWVSLNSCDHQEYYKLMKLSYEATSSKLDELHADKQAGQFPHRVVLSRVVGDDPITDAAFMDGVWNRWPLFHPFLIKRDGWLGYVEPSSKLPPRSGCERWFELNITALGKAVLCCMDGKGEFPQGNVATTSLLDIYNQPRLRERRLKALTRQGIEPCQRCTY